MGTGIPVDKARVSTIARATGRAVDDDLSVEADRGGSQVTVQDVEPISNG